MSTDPALISNILLKKLREETLTAQEVATLAEWEGRSLAHAAFIDNLMDETQLEIKIKNLLEQDSEAGWEKIEQKIYEQEGIFTPKKSNSWYKYAVAASLVLLTGFAVYYFTGRNGLVDPTKTGIPATLADINPGGNRAQLTLANKLVFELDTVQNGKFAQQTGADIIKKDSGTVHYEIKGDISEIAPPMNMLSTPRGGEFRLVLPDGTAVFLNATSSIKFPAFFPKAGRKVEIIGEAYFEVAHDVSKPFIVVVKSASGAEKAEVEALGTHFNIKAYDEQDIISTTLVTGKVRIARYQSADSTTLAPGQQANITAGNELQVVNNADIEQVMAWKNGMFSFKSASIQTVMQEISRWYGIDVVFDGPVSADGFNFDATRKTPLEQMVAALAVYNVTCTLENGKLVVRSKKSL